MKRSLLRLMNTAGLIRETALLYIDERRVRNALRRVGRYIYEQAAALDSTTSPAQGMPLAHAQLGAALADLRYLEAFLDSVRDPGWILHSKAERDLADFAGRMGAQVRVVVTAIQTYLDNLPATLLMASTCSDGSDAATAGGGSEA